jgi:hypothetical protein
MVLIDLSIGRGAAIIEAFHADIQVGPGTADSLGDIDR